MHFFCFMRCFVQQCSKGIADKRTAPEFHGAILFQSHPVHTYYVYAICYRMTPLNGLPCIVPAKAISRAASGYH